MLKLTAKRTKWFTVKEDPSGETKIEIIYLKPGEVADIEAKSNNVKGRQIGDEFETEIETQELLHHLKAAHIFAKDSSHIF